MSTHLPSLTTEIQQQQRLLAAMNCAAARVRAGLLAARSDQEIERLSEKLYLLVENLKAEKYRLDLLQRQAARSPAP